MENQNKKEKVFEKFTWTITNFSTSHSKKLSSDMFSLDGHKWRIHFFPRGNSVDCFSIYLDADVATMPHGWQKFSNFQLILINQLKPRRNIIKESSHTFNSKQGVWGFSFISLGGLWDSSHGFIVNDTCIIEVGILVHKLEDEKQVDESVRVDFRGIGKVEKKFIPLLEEVCSRYPSLIDNKKRKSQIFMEWGFTALGRVLYFLNTNKVRDMDYNACNHLQTLWEELETFEFDLSWLKPHVQSALGMKTSLEKVLAIKRLEEKVNTLEKNFFILEKEAKTLRTKRIKAEVNLEINRRALVKAKKMIDNCDLNAELGYGKP